MVRRLRVGTVSQVLWRETRRGRRRGSQTVVGLWCVVAGDGPGARVLGGVGRDRRLICGQRKGFSARVPPGVGNAFVMLLT